MYTLYRLYANSYRCVRICKYTYVYIHIDIGVYTYISISAYIRVHVVIRVCKGCTYGAVVRVRHCIRITIICLLEEYRGVYIYTIQTEEGRGARSLGDGHHYWY